MPERNRRLDSLMKLCVYTPLNRLAIPSGVPRHIVEMVNGLIRDDSLEIGFLASREDVEKYLKRYAPAWASLPVVTFERSVGYMHRVWGLLNRPSFESLGGEAEWLYLPADGYVPTLRAKLAVTVHDVYKLEPPVPFDNRLQHYNARIRHKIIYARIAKYAERILTVSKFSADRIMHHLGVSANRIEIVSNGVSDAFFSPRTEVWNRLRSQLRLEAGKFLVYSGGLKAKKNARGIIATWSEIERRHPDLRLVVLGHHDPGFLPLAQQTLRNAVFPDRLSDEEMAALLHQSAALFFPSFYEGFGMPAVEAMAAGTLLVLSDIPALREVGRDIAFYVDPTDPAAMARGLEAAVNAVEERRDRIEAARKHAATFTWSACVGRLRSVLT
jgi:glycosyltransferase involved in cell wall biosynthesis